MCHQAHQATNTLLPADISVILVAVSSRVKLPAQCPFNSEQLKDLAQRSTVAVQRCCKPSDQQFSALTTKLSLPPLGSSKNVKINSAC